MALAEPAPSTEYDESYYPIYATPSDLPEAQLLMFALPDLTPRSVAPLLSPQQASAIATQFPPESKDVESKAWYRTEQIRTAYSLPGSLAWSSDGSQLAFAAAIDGPSSDLYVFDLSSGNIRRLTSGSTQTARILWSPDDRFVVHNSIEDFNIGRSGTDGISGLWSAAADGSSLVRLSGGDTTPISWLTPTELLVESWVMPCDFFHLARVDVASAKRELLWEGLFAAADADPSSGTILLGNPYEPIPDDPICPSEEATGLYLISTTDGASSRIGHFEFSQFVSGPYPSIEWSPALGLFKVVDGQGISYFSPQGEEIATSNRTRLPSDAIAGSDLYCNKLWDPTKRMSALTDDSTVYIAIEPEFHPIKIATGLSRLCDYPIQWVTP